MVLRVAYLDTLSLSTIVFWLFKANVPHWGNKPLHDVASLNTWKLLSTIISYTYIRVLVHTMTIQFHQRNLMLCMLEMWLQSSERLFLHTVVLSIMYGRWLEMLLACSCVIHLVLQAVLLTKEIPLGLPPHSSKITNWFPVGFSHERGRWYLKQTHQKYMEVY